jgi:hypothetical protein
MISLPVAQNTGHFFFDIELEGNTYRLEFHYSERAAKWLMNIRDTQDNAIALGIAVVLGADLLKQWHHLAVPPGIMVAFDTSGQELDALLGDLGERVQLYYLATTEI